MWHYSMSKDKNYWGSINLDEIKKAIDGGMIPHQGKKGKYLPVTVWVNEEPDQFGNSLSISIYNKDTKQKNYLGNLKLSEPFEDGASAKTNEVDDLPF